MLLIDDIKEICDRLAPLGWRDLIKAVTNDELDIQQATAAELLDALTKDLSPVKQRFGFEDFHPNGQRGITAGLPARSVLYHALASPNVVRAPGGALLGGFPTLADIEKVENLAFSTQVAARSLTQLTSAGKWAVVVFATEYRPAQDTADRKFADLAFSRTGVGRVGTADPLYREATRGFWPENDTNPNSFRVIPVRFTVWLARQAPGSTARVMRIQPASAADAARHFWIPAHKLFEGDECLTDVPALSMAVEFALVNLKLQRVMKSRKKNESGFPFVIETPDLAELRQKTDLGRFAVVPKKQVSLVVPAQDSAGDLKTYRVPQSEDNRAFATYMTQFSSRVINGRSTEIHRFPAYVHARTKINPGGQPPTDLNDTLDVGAVVAAGNYDAQLYADFTGEGWLKVTVPQINGPALAGPLPAYVLLSAPDFFSSCGQRELSEWSNDGSKIPPSLIGSVWGVTPEPLSEMRLPANLQLTNTPFTADETTVTAVVGMADDSTGSILPLPDVIRSSTLPDDAAGVFAPGWDVSVDVKGPVATGTPHLAAYGLGSPFPEDAKLCAALSTFWPAVAPDVYRSMSMHTGNSSLRGTVAPLTDEEIGQVGGLPWDGVPGPQIIAVAGIEQLEMARFQNVDYVTNAVQNRFSPRLLSRITTAEYENRVLAAARVHFSLASGADLLATRNRTLFLSFRIVTAGDSELQQAQNQTQHTLTGTVYRVDALDLGTADTTTPHGARFVRLPLAGHTRNTIFVSANERKLLKKATNSLTWQSVPSE